MTVAGTWSLKVNSPMGVQENVVTLDAGNGVLTGTSAGPAGEEPIREGQVDGDTVSWKIDITVPMPMTLTFSGIVDGDAISGDCKAGPFGSFPFTGVRG